MPKLNPWQALVAGAVILLSAVLLVATGHKADAGSVGAIVASIIVAILNVRQPPPSGPSVPPVVSAALMSLVLLVLFLVGCGAAAKQELARDDYKAGMHSCVDTADTRAAALACIADKQAEWNDAGAPPALRLDGGAQ